MSVETVEALSSFYEIKFSALSNLDETKNPSARRPFQRAQTLLDQGSLMRGAERSPEECEEFFRETFSLKDVCGFIYFCFLFFFFFFFFFQ